ncbi:hypothetical protein ES705_11742 [subsurface metagenome]
MKTQEKISRICWNKNNWTRPSGRKGKSTNKDTYENKFGYGHEEWLFDKSKLINGFHYAFLQPIGRFQKKYIGEKYNISFYAIEDERQRWWIGKINNVHIISEEESTKTYKIYKKNKWLKEMAEEIKTVGGDVENFYETGDNWFFNIKYKPEDMKLLDIPLPLSKNDPVITASYYVLLDKKKDPNLKVYKNKDFEFIPGFHKKKQKAKAKYDEKEADIDLLHNKIELAICSQIEKERGKNNVGSSNDCGNGSEIDIVEKDNNSFIFYEIKTSNSLKLCIRDALGQLLEYAYYPNKKRAKKIVVVSHNKINEEVKNYLKFLRGNFKLPIYYRCFNIEKNYLEKTEY